MVAFALTAALVLAQSAPGASEDAWWNGEHLSGDWGGARTALAEHGLTIDAIYSAELFANAVSLAHQERAVTMLGHVDLALTLETGKLGLWPGGKLYALGQNNHGDGINEVTGAANVISNLETGGPLTQLTELFFEQAFLDERLKVRIGKQDANREFGTPRYGGNFLNDSFGMYPTSPLPSYPTTGLGAVVVGQPLEWLSLRAGLYEGSPAIGSVGFDSAFKPGAGYTVAGGAAVSHHYGADGRSGGVTSVGVWYQSAELPELTDAPAPRTFGSDLGVLVQNDERIYSNPSNPDDPGGLNVITRFAWSQPDRTPIALYAGGSVAWHGLGARHDDTVGLGVGYLSVAQQLNGHLGPGAEYFVEAFYKLRLTRFLSLQPDLELYRHPGGDGRDAVLAGLRLKAKL